MQSFCTALLHDDPNIPLLEKLVMRAKLRAEQRRIEKLQADCLKVSPKVHSNSTISSQDICASLQY